MPLALALLAAELERVEMDLKGMSMDGCCHVESLVERAGLGDGVEDVQRLRRAGPGELECRTRLVQGDGSVGL